MVVNKDTQRRRFVIEQKIEFNGHEYCIRIRKEKLLEELWRQQQDMMYCYSVVIGIKCKMT